MSIGCGTARPVTIRKPSGRTPMISVEPAVQLHDLRPSDGAIAAEMSSARRRSRAAPSGRRRRRRRQRRGAGRARGWRHRQRNVGFLEVPAEGRPHAEHRQHAGGQAQLRERDELGAAAERGFDQPRFRFDRSRRSPTARRSIASAGERPGCATQLADVDAHQAEPFGFVEIERAEQHALEDREHRRGRADADAENQDHGQREPPLVAEPACRRGEVRRRSVP